MRGVGDVVEDFKVIAARRARRERASARDLAQMYEMLPAIRRSPKPDTGKPYGPKDIEEMSLGQIPRDTASRRTAAVIGTSRKQPAADD